MKWWLTALSFALIYCACTAAPALPELQTGGFTPMVRGEIEKALAEARAHPDDAAAAGHLGMLLDAHEQYEAAASAYRRAAFLAPAVFDWPYLLGCVRASQGRNDEAGIALEKSVRLQGSTVARLKLADARYSTGRVDDAARLYTALVAADDGN